MHSCSSHVHGTASPLSHVYAYIYYHSKLRLLQPDKTIVVQIIVMEYACLCPIVQWLASDAHSDIQTISFPIKGEQSNIYKENESAS